MTKHRRILCGFVLFALGCAFLVYGISSAGGRQVLGGTWVFGGGAVVFGAGMLALGLRKGPDPVWARTAANWVEAFVPIAACVLLVVERTRNPGSGAATRAVGYLWLGVVFVILGLSVLRMWRRRNADRVELVKQRRALLQILRRHSS